MGKLYLPIGLLLLAIQSTIFGQDWPGKYDIVKNHDSAKKQDGALNIDFKVAAGSDKATVGWIFKNPEGKVQFQILLKPDVNDPTKLDVCEVDPDGKESNTGKLVSYNDSCTLVLSIDPDSKTFNAMISDHTSGVDLTFSGKSGDVFSKDQNGGRGKAIALSIDVVGASADSGPGASGLVVSNSVSQWTPGTAAGGGSGITLAATAGNSNQSNNGNFNGAGDVPAPVDLQTSVPVSQ